MAQEKENMPPQGAEAANAPSASEDMDAALDALNGVQSDPKGADTAPQANPRSPASSFATRARSFLTIEVNAPSPIT